jgi:hypothetical protein
VQGASVAWTNAGSWCVRCRVLILWLSVPSRSPMLRALMSARDDVPDQLQRFDEIARSGRVWPSFEEYSARVGEQLSAWRETCYFDVAGDPSLVDVANDRFERLADALGFPVPQGFFEVVRSGAVAGPDVLQIVLGIDAGERARLKYYLIFRAHSELTVERLRAALEVPALPPSLSPGSVYILGIDFGQQRPVTDFKVYVRLDGARVAKVVRNLAQFEALWRGSRYLVFQQCVLGEGRQVYFHASSSSVLEHWLSARAEHDEQAAMLRRQIATMNQQLHREGRASLQPWIASFPYERGQLLPSPSNVYLHFSQ